MIKWTLTQRVWVSFILLILILGVLIAIIYPFSIQQALKNDSYNLIEEEQLHDVLQQPDPYSLPKSNKSFVERQQASRSVGNLLIVNGQGELEGDPVPNKVLHQMAKEADSQKKTLGRYELNYNGATLFYVIRKLQDDNDNSIYLISYMWDTYRNQMAKELWNRLLIVLILAAVLSLMVAAWFAHHLKKPLKVLGSRFEEIASLNWKKPFEWKSGDEFERLSLQFEKMRRNLLRYDESQKTFLQQASHELKTPIMVIQSYAQSVKDGIYPQGTLDDTIDVIINEADQMEHRVKKLLYFTRIDSLREERPDIETVSFGELAEQVKKRLLTQKPSIEIEIKGKNTLFHVDKEQWLIVLENLLENALRYADTKIWLIAEEKDSETRLLVKNDGEPIPEEQMEGLFQPFKKGKKGQFGLGLAIVQRIVERHGGHIHAENDKDGVSFAITIPTQQTESK
ncbi:two-component system sensor histidine kinase CssS [Scopulibacillus daqui]|uniref:histidine kinase n=1 Tax=Scopulibacillus daqui TaxID=1469162 RepID=A0ABS2Q3Q0_9BACL|nr:HAMP domain-containing sensor histidine kinase [Scopulibacillus daqui]MBM7646923.1 two-component system sensor histidine kinase CssS [Scopulibacillus daqui]